MSQYRQDYEGVSQGKPFGSVAQADLTDRLGFIRMTYLHLGLAILAFVAIEVVIFNLFWDQLAGITQTMTQGYAWLIVLAAFVGASWIAQAWANSGSSQAMQYAGLGLFVLAEAIIFVPLLYIAEAYFPGAIQSAALITAIVFIGLTVTVFITRVDFSFLRMLLVVGTLAAFAAIIAGVVLRLDIFGTLFAGAMVLLAAGYILYHTSNVLHHYRTDQYVAAALALFASVALLFWYILQLVMSRR